MIPTPAIFLILSALLPLTAFMLLAFAGKRLGSPLAGYVGTAFAAASFVCTVLAMMSWYGLGTYHERDWGFEKGPINLPLRWIPVGTPDKPGGFDQDNPGFLDVGIFIDSLTIAMVSMVTLVATLVHIFSIGYMREDVRYPRFFTYLGLFCFSMLGLILSGTLLQLFIFWELVGLCSYLLIGFWYEKKSATNAAIKAFVANRVGDFGFLIGLGIVFFYLGNTTLPHMWLLLGKAGLGQAITLPNGTIASTGMLTIMGICLFFGTVGKSAQFPLHIWLPDAMEGPTPVSALIHAATMVAAGVYLLGRIFPLLSPDAKLFIAIIGTVTLTMGALIAIAQTDIKKVIAYSTLSQLGYMVLAMGVGSWVGGLFHLITHAFFKSLLFLACGSVIAAAQHEQEMGEFGGLFRKIPVTAITFLIGLLAISGVGYGGIGFSGYYSKEMILTHAGAFVSWSKMLGRSGAYELFFAIPVIIAYVTPFYMMRCWMLTFWGKPRTPHLYDMAREQPVMWVPLVVLAGLTIISGKAMSVQELIEGSLTENNAYCRQFDASFNAFGSAWPADRPDLVDTAPTESQAAHLRGAAMVRMYLGPWGFSIGILLGFLVYCRGLVVADALLKFPPIRWIRTWLYNRMYFDELYFSVFVDLTVGISRLCGWIDRTLVDGIVNFFPALVRTGSAIVGATDKYIVDGAVNGVADVTRDLGAAVRLTQTGRIRTYVTLLVLMIALGLAVAVITAIAR
jgi:NADH-quinone oxidoreductase subunit L